MLVIVFLCSKEEFFVCYEIFCLLKKKTNVIFFKKKCLEEHQISSLSIR